MNARHRALISALLLCAACYGSPAPSQETAEDAPASSTGEPTPSAPEDSTPDESPADEDPTPDAPTPEPPAPDPFAERADRSEGLINTSADLEAVLEHGTLDGACEAWAADPTNRRKKLLCGKWMFFYEGFGTMGIPQPILDWLGRKLPDEIGPAFSGYGLIQDPYASTANQPRHLGVGVGAPLGGTPTLALTCANCHFGQMPDGRYAVGYPNLEYEYGTHMLSLFIGVTAGVPGFNAADYHPAAVEKVQPIIDRFASDPFLGLDLAWNLLPMLLGGTGDVPSMSWDDQGAYASWAPGTMDFAIAPLPLDDGVHTVSRTLPLWGVPTNDEILSYGMEHALLSWTGSAHSLDEFLLGFVIVGGGPVESWGPDAMAPLREYIESLDAPASLAPAPVADRTLGRAIFREAGCEDCHAGPRGSGLRSFGFGEVGTDATLALWGDPEGDGTPCCGMDAALSGGVKAPRLTGLHALNRFLHNGSLTSLEQLLCVETRPGSQDPPFANYGHEYGCGLPEEERAALLAFLRSL